MTSDNERLPTILTHAVKKLARNPKLKSESLPKLKVPSNKTFHSNL